MNSNFPEDHTFRSILVGEQKNSAFFLFARSHRDSPYGPSCTPTPLCCVLKKKDFSNVARNSFFNSYNSPKSSEIKPNTYSSCDWNSSIWPLLRVMQQLPTNFGFAFFKSVFQIIPLVEELSRGVRYNWRLFRVTAVFVIRWRQSTA